MSLIRRIRSFTVIFLITLLTVFSFSIIIDRLLILNDSKERIHTDHLDRQSALIKSEILITSEMIYSYINYNHTKEEVLHFLKKIRFGKEQDGYIFVVTYDGIILLSDDTQSDLLGVNLLKIEEQNVSAVLKEGKRALENPEGDFIYYSWENPLTGRISPKISFVKTIPEWEWLIGTGVYLDEIEAESSLLEKEIYRNISIRLAVILLIMTSTFLYIYRQFRKFSNSVSKDISIINSHFADKELDPEIFDISTLKYNEFSIIAKHANRMIIRQNKTEKEKKFSDFCLRLQIEQSPLPYIVWDLESRITEWNPAAEKIFGYSKEETVGEFFNFITRESAKAEVYELSRNLLHNDTNLNHINENVTKNGRIITCEWYNYGLEGKEGTKLGFVGIGVDITEKMQFQNMISEKNMELKQSLEEKQILLKEVHHRVKNNMAIISSLLSLQSHHIEDEQLHNLIQSSQNRINSMAMVHEHLYRNESLKDINVKRYITEMTDYLLLNFGYTGDQIALTLDVEDMDLDLDLLITLGMLLNEIISNSFKHAFPVEIAPEVTVILKRIKEDTMYLHIYDNGPGFDPDKIPSREKGIGLMLIEGLVEQIDGKLIVDRKNRTSYEIFF